MSYRLRLTKLIKARGSLSKKLHLDADGKLANDSSQCRMSDGAAQSVAFMSAAELAALINGLGPREAYSNGALRAGLPDKPKIVVRQKLDPSKPDIIARTLDYFAYESGSPGAPLFDVDLKGISPEAERRLDELGGVFGALRGAILGFDKCAGIWRESTSSRLRNADTGTVYQGSGGYHISPFTEDAVDIPRFTKAVKDRLTLLGLSWGMVGANGAFLERCLIDVTVASPERIIFEGRPEVVRPLVQGERPCRSQEGPLLDSRAACLDLTPEERRSVEEFWTQERARLAPEMAAKRKAWVDANVGRLVAAGAPEKEARERVERWADGNELSGDFELVFDDPKLGVVTVANVLRNPDKFDDQTLADPFEGAAYGAGKARLYVNDNGSFVIHSFAHGVNANYRLAAEPSGHPDVEIERLARLGLADFDREREAAAERLSLRVRTLERLVKDKRIPLFSGDSATAKLAAAAELNEDHCVVIIGGQSRVLRFEYTPHFVGEERYIYRLPVYLKFDDFKNYYLNRLTLDENNRPFAFDSRGLPMHLGHWWVESPLRRTYPGVIFKPRGPALVDGRLNLWTDFGVKPEKGDWSLMRIHVRDVLAAGDLEVASYILNWTADLFQRPDRQAKAALVFRGSQGTGKSILGRALCRILGQHAHHISSPEHLTGKFNAHLQRCCFLFADEVVAPQDKKAEGRLKRMITEETLTIEPKGIDPFEAPNFLHIMQASNHKWVAPAEEKERRYVVQDVIEGRQGDAAYFDALHAQSMRDGGLQAMLHDLLDRDIKRFHPRKIVRTLALAKQQEENLSPEDAWWLSLLEVGVIGACPNNPNEAVTNDYEMVEDDPAKPTWKRTVKRPGLISLGRQSSPKLKGMTEAALGRFLSEKGCIHVKIRIDKRIPWGWRFPALAEVRMAWERRFLGTVWEVTPDPCRWTKEED